MQPSFAPWLGYFALIAASDRFVLLDDAQVSPQSWNDRNRIFLQGDQVGWINAPVRKKGNFGKNFRETPLDLNNRSWRKLAKTMAQQYGKAPCFQEVHPVVEAWLAQEHQNLAGLNSSLIMALCARMGIEPDWFFASDLGCGGRRSTKVLEILQKVEADTYFSARGSFGYMQDEGVFPVSGLEVLFQNFQHPSYDQHHSREFTPSLSILDALYNLGFAATGRMIRQAAVDWHTWEEMEAGSGPDSSAAEAEVEHGLS